MFLQSSETIKKKVFFILRSPIYLAVAGETQLQWSSPKALNVHQRKKSIVNNSTIALTIIRRTKVSYSAAMSQ